MPMETGMSKEMGMSREMAMHKGMGMANMGGGHLYMPTNETRAANGRLRRLNAPRLVAQVPRCSIPQTGGTVQ